MHLTYQGLLLYHTVLRQVHSPWHWHDNRYVSKYSGFALLTLVNVPFKYELVGKLYQGTLVILWYFLKWMRCNLLALSVPIKLYNQCFLPFWRVSRIEVFCLRKARPISHNRFMQIDSSDEEVSSKGQENAPNCIWLQRANRNTRLIRFHQYFAALTTHTVIKLSLSTGAWQ